MVSDKLLIDKIYELYKEITNQNKFGLDCTTELKQVKNAEARLQNAKYLFLNNEFIQTHSWKRIHFSTVDVWDIVKKEEIVYRVKDIARSFYNEGTDTFGYNATLNSVFFENELKIEFGYYDEVDVLQKNEPYEKFSLHT